MSGEISAFWRMQASCCFLFCGMPLKIALREADSVQHPAWHADTDCRSYIQANRQCDGSQACSNCRHSDGRCCRQRLTGLDSLLFALCAISFPPPLLPLADAECEQLCERLGLFRAKLVATCSCGISPVACTVSADPSCIAVDARSSSSCCVIRSCSHWRCDPTRSGVESLGTSPIPSRTTVAFEAQPAVRCRRCESVPFDGASILATTAVQLYQSQPWTRTIYYALAAE